MIITIEGKPNEGKTYLAKKISENRKSVFINSKEIGKPFSFMSVENDTEVIIVDDIRTEDFDKVYSVFTQNELKIDRMGQNMLSIKTPDVILIRF